MNRELTFPHLSGRLKRFFSAHSFLFLLYFPLFFVLFELSESGRFIKNYHTIEIIFDRYIPFCSVFVVPYIAWFVFVGGMAAYTYFFEKREFLRYMSFVAITYSVGLITFFAFPSIQHLRPTVFTNPGFFDRLVIGIYASDTNTGVFPSLHVVGQFAVLFASWHCKRLQTAAWRVFFTVSSVLVCASTVFIKQHSLLDVLAGLCLCLIVYPFIYKKTHSAEEVSGT